MAVVYAMLLDLVEIMKFQMVVVGRGERGIG